MADEQNGGLLPCPDEQILQRMLNDDLPHDEAQRIDRHVEACEKCQARLEKIQKLPALRRQAIGVLQGAGGPQASSDLEVTRKDEAKRDGAEVGEPVPALLGGYRIVRELGRGSFASVYQAQDQTLDRLVAIKVPHPDILRQRGGSNLYREEARALAKLDHPHIVRVYHAEVAGDGSCYVVSQFIEGQTLADRLLAGPMKVHDVARLVASLADALQHAHESGITHRDIKPGNILLDQTGKAYLADFGLALKEQEVGGPRGFIGTFAYMSPEQARGLGNTVDGRTDIYSLGVVFFEALTGRRPFISESPSALLDLIANVQAPSPRMKNGAIPAELDRICARALALRVQDRYGSARELADDLQNWLKSEGQQIVFEVRPTLGGCVLRGRIGAGGMGDVYRAWQVAEGREVALKCLRRGTEKDRKRFINEIRALGTVTHPNLVRIYTSSADDKQAYYVMELIDGANFKTLYRQLQQADTLDDETWREVLSKASHETRGSEQEVGNSLPDESALEEQEPLDYLDFAPTGVCQSDFYVRHIVRIVAQVTRATQALHEKDVIHRDIKPENIMVSREGDRAVLMDLGIAKLAKSEQGHLTRTREFVGSLRYASPEQVLDAGEIDHRSDIYSLGVTLWELLTLRPIYGVGKDTPDIKAMLKIQSEEAEAVRKYNKTVSRDLEAVVQRCLEKNPNQRYASATALAEDLERVLKGEPTTARPRGPVTRLWRKVWQQPVVLGMTAALVLLVGVIVALAFSNKPEPRPTLIKPDEFVLRVAVKPWVGYSPLGVIRDENLCGKYQLKFIPVKDTTEALQGINKGEIDVMMCPLETLVAARGDSYRIKALLLADESYGADAVVAKSDIKRPADLAGKKIVYMHHDAPHYLLMAMCEKEVDRSKLQLTSKQTPEQVRDAFRTGDYDAAVLYEPFLEEAKAAQLGSWILRASGERGKERPIIVDLLVIQEDWLNPEKRPGAEAFIEGWCEGVKRLEAGDTNAIRSARQLMGELLKLPEPISEKSYRTAASGMKNSGKNDNLRFFTSPKGKSEFHERVSSAWKRLNDWAMVNDVVNPQDVDASAVLVEMFRDK